MPVNYQAEAFRIQEDYERALSRVRAYLEATGEGQRLLERHGEPEAAAQVREARERIAAVVREAHALYLSALGTWEELEAGLILADWADRNAHEAGTAALEAMRRAAELAGDLDRTLRTFAKNLPPLLELLDSETWQRASEGLRQAGAVVGRGLGAAVGTWAVLLGLGGLLYLYVLTSGATR